ncbi:ABC transporter ATP-binding protein [Streptomyces sp. NPDC001276]|uniref:ABC transporter ATP-binding protein n=1 Tax=Streptomyces sp. NPDC001276 TaxID=3364555 RepID=UPI0036B1007F
MTSEPLITVGSSRRLAGSAHDAAGPLSIRDLTVSFGGVRALSSVSADVPGGEISAIVGPNGAGKTTLLNAIGGLLGRAVHGTVTFDGSPITRRSPTNLARLGLARSFQEPRLIEQASALENVLAGAYLHMGYSTLDQMVRPWRVKKGERGVRDQIVSLLTGIGLAHVRDEPVAGLPYGVRKLIDITRALASAPRLLLLDEPTSGLDSSDRRTVEELLAGLRAERRVTVVVVEHHMDLVRRVADRAIGMAAGCAIATGTPTEVLDSKTFRAAVVGRPVDAGSSPAGKNEDATWTGS